MKVKKHQQGEKVMVEANTRYLIDTILTNKKWILDDNKGKRNVFFEGAKTEKQKRMLKGKRPDYILYEHDTDNPIAIIEAKKGGADLGKALEQGTEYAKLLEVPLVFAMNGPYCETRFVPNNKSLILDNHEVNELLRETEAIKFLKPRLSNEAYTLPKEFIISRDELIKIFEDLNDILRSEGLRAGIERFSEFANILFLKLLGEDKEESHWELIKEKSNKDLISYVNKTVMADIKEKYNDHQVFSPLLIKNAKTLRYIIDRLDPLVFSKIGMDIKGTAFEYFLQKTTSTQNDLGEYFTPRNIVKTIINLVNPKFKEKIYDPFCGTGGFLTCAFNYVKENNIIKGKDEKLLQNKMFYGREITTTARIAKMNMILHGDGHSGVEQIDALSHPDYIDREKNKSLKFDIVVTNMPFSQSIATKVSVGGKLKTENYISPLYYNGLAKNNGDAACVLHCLNSLTVGGRMALVVPEGFLFRKDISNVRKFLLSKAKLQSVISLPQGSFLPYTGVKTSILYFTNAHEQNNQKEYWFFDVKNIGETLDNRKRKISGINDLNKIDSSDIKKVEKDCSLKENLLEIGFEIINLEKIKNNNYNLGGNFYREDKGFVKNQMILLREICELLRGVTYKKDEESAVETANCILRSNNINLDGSINFDSLVFLNSNIEVDKRKNLKEHDILICLANGSKSHLGKSCIIKKEMANKFYAGGFMGIVRVNDRILPQYLNLIFKSKAWKGYINKTILGTNINNLNSEVFFNFKIPILPISDQQKIIDELDSYQKIIDGANSVIKVYKPFLKFKEKWSLTKISESIKIHYGKSLPEEKRMKGEYPVVGSNGIIGYHNKYIVRGPSIVIGRKGSAGEVNLIKENCFPIDTTFYLEFDDKDWDYFYLFYLLKNINLQSKKGGTGVPGISRDDLYEISVYKPPLVEQMEISKNLQEEEKLILSQQKLINIFKQKIEDRLNSIWN